MEDQLPENASQEFEQALHDLENRSYILRLYIAGNTKKSADAIVSLRKVCEEHLSGRYQLEVIDIHQQPAVARGEQIIATPTLIKYLPLPLRRIIGDLSKTERIMIGLDLQSLNE